MFYYVSDVWVNFVDGAMKGYEVPEAHEWRNSDPITLIDMLAVLKVKEGFFDYVETGMNELPQDLLETVKNESELRDHTGDWVENSVFGITDGKRVLVVDPGESNTPGKKSRVIHKQGIWIIRETEDWDTMKFEYEPVEEDMDDLTSPPSLLMIGLNRKERELKKTLIEALLLSFHDENLDRIKYWYGEWNYEGRDSVEGLDYKELFTLLFNEISALGWNDNHMKLLNTISKYNKDLKEALDGYFKTLKGTQNA